MQASPTNEPPEGAHAQAHRHAGNAAVAAAAATAAGIVLGKAAPLSLVKWGLIGGALYAYRRLRRHTPETSSTAPADLDHPAPEPIITLPSAAHGVLHPAAPVPGEAPSVPVTGDPGPDGLHPDPRPEPPPQAAQSSAHPSRAPEELSTLTAADCPSPPSTEPQLDPPAADPIHAPESPMTTSPPPPDWGSSSLSSALDDLAAELRASIRDASAGPAHADPAPAPAPSSELQQAEPPAAAGAEAHAAASASQEAPSEPVPIAPRLPISAPQPWPPDLALITERRPPATTPEAATTSVGSPGSAPVPVSADDAARRKTSSPLSPWPTDLAAPPQSAPPEFSQTGGETFAKPLSPVPHAESSETSPSPAAIHTVLHAPPAQRLSRTDSLRILCAESAAIRLSAPAVISAVAEPQDWTTQPPRDGDDLEIIAIDDEDDVEIQEPETVPAPGEGPAISAPIPDIPTAAVPPLEPTPQEAPLGPVVEPEPAPSSAPSSPARPAEGSLAPPAQWPAARPRPRSPEPAPRPPSASPFQVASPFHPASPHAAIDEQESPAEEPVRQRPPRRKRPWLLATVAVGLIALAAGAALSLLRGLPSAAPDSPSRPDSPGSGSPAPLPAPAQAESPSEAAEPPPLPETGQTPVPAVDPEIVTLPPREVLQRFLAAATPQERAAWSLPYPERNERMEAFHRLMPDLPDPFTDLRAVSVTTPPREASDRATFEVRLASLTRPVPVFLQETENGFRVDWQAYVQFKEGLFRRFGEGSFDLWSDMYVILQRGHNYDSDFPGADRMLWFILSCPGSPGFDQRAFVDKASPLGRELEGHYEFQKEYQVVAGLRRVEQAGGSSLELLAIRRPSWEF